MSWWREEFERAELAEKEIERLRSELMTAYDLVAESISDKQSYDFNARAQAFVNKHISAQKNNAK